MSVPEPTPQAMDVATDDALVGRRYYCGFAGGEAPVALDEASMAALVGDEDEQEE